MLNVKLLVASSAFAAGAWKVWSSPTAWSLLLHVLGALALSWVVFVAVLYLTAMHLRRPSAPSHIPRPMAPAARLTQNYNASPRFPRDRR